MQFPLIDVLRAVAVMLVLIYHVVALGDWSLFSGSAWGLPFRQGWIGVDLFLVISGFVITLSAVRELENGGAGYFWKFMQRRLRRLVPLYVLTCVIFVFLVRPEILTLPTAQLWLQVASHALFMQNLLPWTHGVINGVTWSLALEMQFYICLALGIGWLMKLGAWRTILILVSLSWAWRYGSTFVLKPGEAVAHMQVIFTTQLPGTLDAFGMGIALALLTLKSRGAGLKLLLPMWSNCLLWLTLAMGILWMAGSVFLPVGNYWANTGIIVFWRTALALGFGAALAAVITCPVQENRLLMPLRYLGQISYGVYLWHFPVLLTLITLPGLRGGRLFLVLFIGSVLLASLSWHLLEKHWARTPK